MIDKAYVVTTTSNKTVETESQMESIILVGHGSMRKEANNLDLIGRLLHRAIHPNCDQQCVKVAYLQFSEPDLMDAIKDSVTGGSNRIIVHPYFLSTGNHVMEDIPAVINQAKALYPAVEFVYTEPLGVHEKLVQVVLERIDSAKGLSPKEIEQRSFEIIEGEIDLSDVPSEQVPIIKRVIHATADFEFKTNLLFHPNAIKRGLEAIKSGMDILTDVEMVRAGINKDLLSSFGGRVLCHISEPEVVNRSIDTEKTKAELAIEYGLRENVGIVVIGNAPTALLKVIEILNSDHRDGNRPLVIGVPVGFVKALESKALLSAQPFPFITNISRKGGSTVAVAIVNALLRMAQQ